MFDVKTIASAAITAVVVVLIAGLVGDNQSVGGYTRFPNSDVVVKSLELDNGSATTTMTLDKVCFVGTETDGTSIYYFFGANGDWATSSTACN